MREMKKINENIYLYDHVVYGVFPCKISVEINNSKSNVRTIDGYCVALFLNYQYVPEHGFVTVTDDGKQQKKTLQELHDDTDTLIYFERVCFSEEEALCYLKDEPYDPDK